MNNPKIKIYASMLFLAGIFVAAMLTGNLTPKKSPPSAVIPPIHDTITVRDTVTVQDTSYTETIIYFKQQNDLLWQAIELMGAPPQNVDKINQISQKIVALREKHNVLVVNQTQADIQKILNRKK